MIALALVFAFVGNAHIATDVLRAELAGDDNAIAGKTDSEALDGYGERVAYYYRERGFLTTVPKTAVHGDTVTLTVDEGEHLPLTIVQISGELIGSEADNIAIGKFPLGVPYDLDAVTAAIARLRLSYRDRGYAAVYVQAQGWWGSDDQAAHRMRELVTLSHGRLYHVGAITVTGATGAREAAIRKALTFATGQKYSATNVADSQRKLAALHATLVESYDGPDKVAVAITAETGN